MDPHNAQVYCDRGLCRESQGDLDGALQDFTKAIQISPLEHWPFYCRAEIWLKKGATENALRDLSEIIRLDSDPSSAYQQRAEIWLKEGKIEAAIQDYIEVLRISPDILGIAEKIAWWRATHHDERFRDGDEAVEYATRSCRYLNSPIQMTIMAAAYAEVGDFASAIEWQAKAIASGSTGDIDRHRLELYRTNKPYREVSIMESKRA